MKKSLTLFLLSICFLSEAQVKFQKRFGGMSTDQGMFVQQTTDGGFIMTGYTYSFTAGESDIYLVKTDANGNLLWTRTFGGTDFDYGYCGQQTADGGYIITGTTKSFGASQGNVYLIKTNASGIASWTKRIGVAGGAGGNSVQQTTDGGYIITGGVSSSGGNYQAFLLKTDAFGDSLWTKTYGGTAGENGKSVQQTMDGGFIMTGNTSSFSAGSSDIYLVKTDVNGDTLWARSYGGTASEYGYFVQQTTDGGYIITGITYSFGAGGSDVYLIKTDAIGDTLWTRTFGGTASDAAHSVRQTTDGGYIFGAESRSFGSGNNDAYLVKTDANGNLSWSKRIGDANYNEEGYSVEQTTDGGYVISGSTDGFGAYNSDVYIIKTDSLGNGGCNHNVASSIVTSPVTQVMIPATMVVGTAPFFTATTATVSGIGNNTYSICTTVGLNEVIEDNSFHISPNPSVGNFIISFENIIYQGHVEILNIVGENVFSQDIFNESTMDINLKNIPSGIYFIQVNSETFTGYRKIVISE